MSKKSQNANNILLVSLILLIFILFLFISHNIPLTGDDWTNYLYKTTSLSSTIRIVIGKYLTFEGRIFSRIFILMLINNKLWWEIINAFVIAAMFAIMNLLSNSNKSKNLMLIIFLSILFVPNDVFRQCFVWVTGSITYMLPIGFLFIFLFIHHLYTLNNRKFRLLYVTLLCLISLVNSMMVEHVSALMFFIGAYYLIKYFVIERKMDYFLLPSMLISLFGSIAMYLSPGVKARLLAWSPEFAQLSIFSKIKGNISNFISYTFISNTFLICLLVLVMSNLIRLRFSGWRKHLIMIALLVIPLVNVAMNMMSIIYAKSSQVRMIYDFLHVIVDPNNIPIQLFWVVFTLTLIWFLLFNKTIDERSKIVEFLLFGLVSNFVMLLSPIWGARTSATTIFMLYTSCFIYLGNNMQHSNKRFEFLSFLGLQFILITSVICSIILFNSVSSQQTYREKSIRAQINQGKTEIEIERFPKYTLWNADAWNEFHEERFRTYYGIDPDVTIKRVPISYSYFIFYQSK